MDQIKVVLNSQGIRSVLKSSEMRSICAKKAEGIVSRCGVGFSSDTYIGENRVNSMVKAETNEAKKKCFNDNILLKNLR